MAWQTPKTNWSSEDGVMASDLNRIEGNIQDLNGRGVDLSQYMVTAPKTIYVAYNGNTTGDGTVSSPYRYLNQAIAALPKNLNGNTVTIQIAGTLTDSVVNTPLTITGFSNGRITLSAAGAGPIMMCSSNVTVSNGSIVDITGFTNAAFYGGLAVAHNAFMYVSCPLSVRNGSLQANNGGRFANAFSTTIMAAGIGVYATGGGHVWMNECFIQSDVQNGLWVNEGSVISYGTVNNNATATKTYTSTGGRILAGAQSSIPNY